MAIFFGLEKCRCGFEYPTIVMEELVIPARNVSKAQFKRRSFHEPNQIPAVKFMKSSAFESIKNG